MYCFKIFYTLKPSTHIKINFKYTLVQIVGFIICISRTIARYRNTKKILSKHFAVVWDNVGKKLGRAKHATYDNIIWRMRFASWITQAVHTHKHTHTHSEYVIHNALPLP